MGGKTGLEAKLYYKVGGVAHALAILDEAKETGTGLVADFAVANFSRNEPLEEAMTANVTAKPTYSATAPVWMEQGVPALDGA